ncbi:sn1-specific diacylglycerol lipase beta-like isoform X2 [Pecten maximus]|uniref:sn1-specific diacylglycerol lipase beta-like isoform X2 n=1 Tax=Pecten maximus TaxID=6579 RepID=UPI0014586EDE|nr:sn1-specific diacylglycerol lipase beta-like isoform X2 [Pecten maximus]
MPGLILFGRRWGIGSDDFVFPVVAEIFLRLAWLIAISIVFHIHQAEPQSCSGGTLLQAYFIGALCLLCLTIVLDMVIVYTSMQGSIMYPYPRKRMPRLLYVKMSVSVPELAWIVLGTYWSFGLASGCEPSVVMTVKGAVLCGWVIAFLILIGLFIVFDPLGGLRAKRSQGHIGVLESSSQQQVLTTAHHTAMKTWERRCKILCCCVSCDDQSHDAFTEIAKLLTDFFQDVELDLVATDIAAGLILVNRDQEVSQLTVTTDRTCETYGTLSQERKPHYSPVTTDSQVSDTGTRVEHPSSSSGATNSVPTHERPPLPPQDWMNIRNMSHYMKYAMASYGWPLFVFANLSLGLCKLCGECRCCACARDSGEVHYDNCCQCHTAAIRRWTDVDDADLLYVSFYNKIYALPFFVAVDRKEKSVVVSVRGTLSLRDALTDMSADCVCIEQDGCSDWKCHKGIYQAACYIRDELQTKHILEKAFEQNQGARLVVTGHSLGAGAAALLAILLKPNYPDLICFTFSPPGGLLSLEASTCCSDYICSVVLGRDLVPRLGICSMEHLKTSILTAIRCCDRPKYQVIASGMWQAVCALCPGDNAKSCGCGIDQPLIQDSGTSAYVTGQRNVEEAIQSAIMQSEQYRITYPTMYPPGQVLHIMEVDSDRSCFASPAYFAEWKTPADFQEILVSPDMLTDHLPDNVWKALVQLADKQFNPKPPRCTSSTAM